MSKLPFFIITMKAHDEAWKRVSVDARRAGFQNVIRREAVNGKELSDAELRKLLTTYAYSRLKYSHIRLADAELPSVGAIGCALSHFRIAKWMLKHPKIPFVLVGEEDLIFKENFQCDFKDLMGQLQVYIRNGGNFDLAFLDCFNRQFMNLEQTSMPNWDRLMPNSHMQGTHFYLMSQSGARKIVALSKVIDAQIDALYSASVATGMVILVNNRIVAAQKATFHSSIQDLSRPNFDPRRNFLHLNDSFGDSWQWIQINLSRLWQS